MPHSEGAVEWEQVGTELVGGIMEAMGHVNVCCIRAAHLFEHDG